MAETYHDPVMRLRQRLATEIAHWITLQGITQEEAASRLGFTQRKVSDLVNGHLQSVTAESMLRAWVRIGGDFDLTLSMR